MNLLLAFVCVMIAHVGLSATYTFTEKDTTGNSENGFQLKEMQERVQQLEEWKDAMSKEVDLLRRVLWDKEKSPSNKVRRRRSHTINESDCTPGTLGCPLLVTLSTGSSCSLCSDGPRGYIGPAGPPGRDGRDAIAIISSTDHSQHQAPTSHIHDVTRSSNTSGAVYVRWGHHECPPTSQLIYSGSAAGTHYGHSGGAADRLCLPASPIYDSPVVGVGGSRSFVYGVEYQITNFPEFDSKQWHDVPCAVCLAPTRFAILVMPATNLCPSTEWTREYGGYLMTERVHGSHKRSMHVCVDREMQTITRTSKSASARGLLDLVEGRCSTSGGGIPCGPYIDGYELTCAVCTM